MKAQIKNLPLAPVLPRVAIVLWCVLVTFLATWDTVRLLTWIHESPGGLGLLEGVAGVVSWCWICGAALLSVVLAVRERDASGSAFLALALAVAVLLLPR